MGFKTMPFARPNLFLDKIQKDPDHKGTEFWFIFKDSKLLIDQNSFNPFQPKNLPLKHSLYMGTFKEMHIHVAEAISSEAPSQAHWEDLKKLYGKMDEELFGLASRAVQLVTWEKTHQYCGACGSKTKSREKERAKECSLCKLLSFPKICPVVMALVKRGDEILLARGVNFPAGFYSALAGYVDAGETLEQCVKREIFEEVGLTVDNIRYFSSQPWPFPNSLMIAFTCDWKEGEIKINPEEIVDAQWFKKDNLPLLPPEHSISRILIDSILSSVF